MEAAEEVRLLRSSAVPWPCVCTDPVTHSDLLSSGGAVQHFSPCTASSTCPPAWTQQGQPCCSGDRKAFSHWQKLPCQEHRDYPAAHCHQQGGATGVGGLEVALADIAHLSAVSMASPPRALMGMQRHQMKPFGSRRGLRALGAQTRCIPPLCTHPLLQDSEAAPPPDLLLCSWHHNLSQQNPQRKSSIPLGPLGSPPAWEMWAARAPNLPF